MLRLIYSFFFAIALPFIFVKLYVRGKKAPDYRKRWKERLGFCDFRLKHSIWIHSVSMGESIAVAPLVKKLIKKYPHENFVVTTMTPTGSVQVKKNYADYQNVYHCYLPYDLQCFVERLVKRIRPAIVIIVETELWPNMLHVCHKKNIKTLLTNARLSQRSADGYKKIAWVSRLMFNNINQIAVQTVDDATRFIDIGYPKSRCQICGNLKYDIQIDILMLEKAAEFKKHFSQRKVWIAASTHQGEDEIIFHAHRALLSKIPSALLIIVPRHPERFANVGHLAESYGFDIVTRSSQKNITSEAVLIGDSMGEMMFYYALSDAVFIGGSLVKHGGQNMIEPAALKKPILSGEHLFNFSQISKLMIDADGLKVVKSATEITENITLLFNDIDLCKQQGINAYNIVKLNQGALDRQFDVAVNLIEK